MLTIVNYNKDEYNFPALLVLGCFDAIHIGHEELLKKAKLQAKINGLDLGVMMFNTGKGGKQLYSFEERCAFLEKFNVKFVLNIDYTEEFKKTTAEQFLEIVERFINVKGYMSGKDFRFGAGAKGKSATLKKYADDDDNAVWYMPVKDVMSQGEKVSTTLIKECLEQGAISRATQLLGREYSVKGVVSDGHERGTSMGIPTANIVYPENKTEIKQGVYGVDVSFDGNTYRGVANYGGRPTFGEESPVLETYIVDYSGDLYGKEITVSFKNYIRDIRKFDDAEALTAQIHADICRIGEPDSTPEDEPLDVDAIIAGHNEPIEVPAAEPVTETAAEPAEQVEETAEPEITIEEVAQEETAEPEITIEEVAQEEIPVAEQPVEETAEEPAEDVAAEEPAEETTAEEEITEQTAEPAEQVEETAEPEITIEEVAQEEIPVAEEPAEEIIAEEPAEIIAIEEPAEETTAEEEITEQTAEPAEQVEETAEPEITIEEVAQEEIPVAEEPAEEIIAEEPAEIIASEEPAEETAEEPDEVVAAEQPAEETTAEEEITEQTAEPVEQVEETAEPEITIEEVAQEEIPVAEEPAEETVEEPAEVIASEEPVEETAAEEAPAAEPEKELTPEELAELEFEREFALLLEEEEREKAEKAAKEKENGENND